MLNIIFYLKYQIYSLYINFFCFMNKNFIRIIPRLDIKNGVLIKGINFEGLRVLGEPENFSQFYYNCGADEISYLDNVATLYGTNNLGKFITQTAKKLYIPLNVGGGIRSLKDIEAALKCGADKVSINTALVQNVKFAKEASRIFGSSTISATIEINKYNGKYYVMSSHGRDFTKKNPLEWAKKLEGHGIGEIIISSIHKDGLESGFDIDITKKISKVVKVPTLAHGGCGKIKHIIDVVKKTNITGVILSSFLHYNSLQKFKKKKIKIGNLTYYNNYKIKKNVPNLIMKIKKKLIQERLNVRI